VYHYQYYQEYMGGSDEAPKRSRLRIGVSRLLSEVQNSDSSEDTLKPAEERSEERV
jgi:hypothetical protein